MKRWRLRQWAVWLLRHPSDGRLLSLHDGGTAEKCSVRIRAHLLLCLRCRTRAAQIADELRSINALNAAANPVDAFSQEELTEKIRASMQAWSAANPAAIQNRELQKLAETEAGRQVAAVLETYLGRRAASALLRTDRSTPVSEQGSFAEIWPALRVLLGRKSAAAVEERLLRIAGQFTKSAGRSSNG